jgi:hypothetical protein
MARDGWTWLNRDHAVKYHDGQVVAEVERAAPRRPWMRPSRWHWMFTWKPGHFQSTHRSHDDGDTHNTFHTATAAMNYCDDALESGEWKPTWSHDAP